MSAVRAIELARLGLSAIPITPRGKRPLVQWEPCQRTPMTELQLEQHWRRWPNANIGAVCGAVSGVFVLDVDPRHAGDRTLADLVDRHAPLPLTWHSRTGNGEHWWFRLPAGRQCRNTAGRLGPGLDTRGEGGFVVAPGSTHENGTTYEWLPDGDPGDVALANAPQWLLDMLDRPIERKILAPARFESLPAGPLHRYAACALEAELNAVKTAIEGCRNHTLNAAGFNLGQLIGGGFLSEDHVRNALLTAGQEAGLGARECLTTIASGITAGMRQPRGIPERGAA